MTVITNGHYKYSVPYIRVHGQERGEDDYILVMADDPAAAQRIAQRQLDCYAQREYSYSFRVSGPATRQGG